MLLALAYVAIRALLGLLLLRLWRASASDVELLVLRHEAHVRRSTGRQRGWRASDRLLLAALSRCLSRRDWGVLPAHPDTLVRWHRALRAGACPRAARRGPGRPPLPAEVCTLMVRLARENPGWGYQRIRGELRKLGHTVSATAIRTTLRRRGIPPAPRRARLTWPVFLRAQARAMLASGGLDALGRPASTTLMALALYIRSACPAGAPGPSCAARVVGLTRPALQRPAPVCTSREARARLESRWGRPPSAAVPLSARRLGWEQRPEAGAHAGHRWRGCAHAPTPVGQPPTPRAAAAGTPGDRCGASGRRRAARSIECGTLRLDRVRKVAWGEWHGGPPPAAPRGGGRRSAVSRVHLAPGAPFRAGDPSACRPTGLLHPTGCRLESL
jgi:hypothetical protein